MSLAAPYSPEGSTEELFPGTWYLTAIDAMHRGVYKRKPLSEKIANCDDHNHSMHSTLPVRDDTQKQNADLTVEIVHISEFLRH